MDTPLDSASIAQASGYSTEVAGAIVDQCADAGIELVASLPDDWISLVIDRFDKDFRFTHIPVNREESAIGLCSGAFMSGTGALALMGASGLMTLVYALTKINFTYEIPVFIIITQRGSLDDGAKFHVSNGLYLERVMDSISLPHVTIDSSDRIPEIAAAFRHSRKISRPTVAVLSKRLLQGKA